MQLDVEPAPVSGSWYRHIPASGDVFHEPDHPADGRWQRGDVVEALYLAPSEPAMWAEWYRFLAEMSLPPDRLLPRDVWTWELALPGVADLSTAERLERVDLRWPRPTRQDWPDFQAVGEQLWREGWPAVLFPSACHAESVNVCVFREQRIVPGARPMPPPTTQRTAPAPPTGLRT